VIFAFFRFFGTRFPFPFEGSSNVSIAVKLRPVEELAPYAANARKHSPAAIKRLVKIIEDMGWTNPILVDVDGIVAGHKRRLAALAIYEKGGRIKLPGGDLLPQGMVPVLDVTGWSEAQRRAYILADNQTTLESEWDEGILRLEVGYHRLQSGNRKWFRQADEAAWRSCLNRE
jgi:hypothetical protein